MSRIGLIFHGIGQPRRSMEQGEAPFWISVSGFERALDRIEALPDPDRVRITFDDGNVSDTEIALPRLLERGLRAEFFVLTDRLDQPGSLSRVDLLELQAAGMGLGSHGCGHLDLTKLSDVALAEELSRSKSLIEQVLIAPINEFGIPFGAYNGRVLQAIKAAGYRAAWSSDRGMMSDRNFLRPRSSIREDTSPEALDRILTGQMRPAEALRRRLGMLRRRLSRR